VVPESVRAAAAIAEFATRTLAFARQLKIPSTLVKPNMAVSSLCAIPRSTNKVITACFLLSLATPSCAPAEQKVVMMGAELVVRVIFPRESVASIRILSAKVMRVYWRANEVLVTFAAFSTTAASKKFAFLSRGKRISKKISSGKQSLSLLRRGSVIPATARHRVAVKVNVASATSLLVSVK